MVLSDGSDDQQYWYARVVGIFHANVRYNNGPAEKMDFLWVRWFGLDVSYKAGWNEKRLPRVGFIDGHEDCSFGFLDPASVIRAVHLVPAFALGKTSTIMGPSIVRKESEKDEDWWRYYINL
jgi:hypothetical protein